jgi:hypothetical protein
VVASVWVLDSDAQQVGIRGGCRRGEGAGGGGGGAQIDVEVETAAVRRGTDNVRGGGDVRDPGRSRKIAEERIAGTVLRHVATIQQQVAARRECGADRGELRLVGGNIARTQQRAAELQLAIGAIRNDGDGGEVLDIVLLQIIGDLLHAVRVGVENDYRHARLHAVREDLVVGHAAFDEHDLLTGTAGWFLIGSPGRRLAGSIC